MDEISTMAPLRSAGPRAALASFDAGRYAGCGRAGIVGDPPGNAPTISGARDGRVVLCKSDGRKPVRYELIVERSDVMMPEKSTQKRVEPHRRRHSQ
jgi:hypothetical protein